MLELLFISALRPASDSQNPGSPARGMRVENLFPCANQIRHVFLRMKSAQVKENFSVFSKYLRLRLRRLAPIRQINAIRNDANRIAHSVRADRLRFRFAQRTEARCAAQMPIFIKQRSDSFFPLRISQRP